MQEMRDASSRDSGNEEAGEGHGIHEDTNGVKCLFGADAFTRRSKHALFSFKEKEADTPKGKLEWLSITSPLIPIDQSLHLALLDGASIQTAVFSDKSFIIPVKDKKRGAQGPFLFLAGKVSSPFDTSPHLKDVVLAVLRKIPDGLTQQEVLGTLVSSLQSA